MHGIYYVILHYQSIDDTIECAESILNNPGCVYSKIIIVDNNSPNKSGLQLRKLYENNDRIHIMLNKKNEGYAKGNNMGYRYAKQMGAQFIVQINNDTILDDQKFEITLSQLYRKYNFGVLGPDVYSLADKRHQNPLASVQMTTANIKKQIYKNKIAILLNIIGLDKYIKNITKKQLNQSSWKDEMFINPHMGYVLQGACLVFSPLYIKIFDGLYEGTFMYYEEHILAYYCQKSNVSMLYSPKLQIKHKEGSATGYVLKSNRNKRKFVYTQSIASLRNFLNDK